MAYTRLKELDTFRSNSSCCFCKQNINDDILYGKIYQFGDIITHYFCMLFSSQMEQNGKDEDGILGFLPADIKKELSRGLKLTCIFCHREGATISCSIRLCKKRYHFPCAIKNGSLHQFFGQFKSFCSQHRRVQAVPSHVCKSSETYVCVMCQEQVKARPSHETIWTPCCKTAWFHRLCVQKMAVSAGYFFKCPNCNNKDKFRNEMLECGIYIPDQDASWELEPNAFQELNERHNQCDAVQCTCPDGRTFSSSEGNWEITLCCLCGSQGIHAHCGTGEIDKKGQWTCSFCCSIVNKIPTVSNTPGPSVTTRGHIRRIGRRVAGRKRNVSPADMKELPPAKTVAESSTQTSSCDITKSDDATCLYGNSGEAIHVVKLNNIETTGGEIVEIGGVNIAETIDVDSSDDDDNIKPNLRLPNRSNVFNQSENNRLSLPDTKTNTATIIIDLLDSDDELEESSSSTPLNRVNGHNEEEDDDVIFVDYHMPEKNKDEIETSSAMIGFVENNTVHVFSPAEVKKRESSNAAILTVHSNVVSSSNNSSSSNVIWQSVPRHKSMLHSLHLSPKMVSSDAFNNNNSNRIDGIDQTSRNEKPRLSKVVPNGVVRVSDKSESVTNGRVAKRNEILCRPTEIIDLD